MKTILFWLLVYALSAPIAVALYGGLGAAIWATLDFFAGVPSNWTTGATVGAVFGLGLAAFVVIGQATKRIEVK